ncbi:MAG: PilZ domain-containing protein [Pseudomonadota bacterium]
MDDNRKRKRVNFRTRVHLKDGDRQMTGLPSRDLSLKGLYIETGENLALDTEVEIYLELSGASPDLELHMKGRVVRQDPGGLAVDFVEVDLDSFSHLRNIVLYNSEDPAEVDQELVSKPAF